MYLHFSELFTLDHYSSYVLYNTDTHQEESLRNNEINFLSSYVKSYDCLYVKRITYVLFLKLF